MAAGSDDGPAGFSRRNFLKVGAAAIAADGLLGRDGNRRTAITPAGGRDVQSDVGRGSDLAGNQRPEPVGDGRAADDAAERDP